MIESSVSDLLRMLVRNLVAGGWKVCLHDYGSKSLNVNHHCQCLPWFPGNIYLFLGIDGLRKRKNFVSFYSSRKKWLWKLNRNIWWEEYRPIFLLHHLQPCLWICTAGLPFSCFPSAMYIAWRLFLWPTFFLYMASSAGRSRTGRKSDHVQGTPWRFLADFLANVSSLDWGTQRRRLPCPGRREWWSRLEPPRAWLFFTTRRGPSSIEISRPRTSC